MMIPDCHRRLITAHTDLMNVLEQEVINQSMKGIALSFEYVWKKNEKS